MRHINKNKKIILCLLCLFVAKDLYPRALFQDIGGSLAFQGQDIVGGAAIIFKPPQRVRDITGGAAAIMKRPSRSSRPTEVGYPSPGRSLPGRRPRPAWRPGSIPMTAAPGRRRPECVHSPDRSRGDADAAEHRARHTSERQRAAVFASSSAYARASMASSIARRALSTAHSA